MHLSITAQMPGPQEEERVRLVREVGEVLVSSFGGRAANLVRSAGGSAPGLVDLLTQHFPGFRDHCIYRGRQVHLCKRSVVFLTGDRRTGRPV